MATTREKVHQRELKTTDAGRWQLCTVVMMKLTGHWKEQTRAQFKNKESHVCVSECVCTPAIVRTAADAEIAAAAVAEVPNQSQCDTFW